MYCCGTTARYEKKDLNRAVAAMTESNEGNFHLLPFEAVKILNKQNKRQYDKMLRLYIEDLKERAHNNEVEVIKRVGEIEVTAIASTIPENEVEDLNTKKEELMLELANLNASIEQLDHLGFALEPEPNAQVLSDALLACEIKPAKGSYKTQPGYTLHVPYIPKVVSSVTLGEMFQEKVDKKGNVMQRIIAAKMGQQVGMTFKFEATYINTKTEAICNMFSLIQKLKAVSHPSAMKNIQAKPAVPIHGKAHLDIAFFDNDKNSECFLIMEVELPRSDENWDPGLNWCNRENCAGKMGKYVKCTSLKHLKPKDNPIRKLYSNMILTGNYYGVYTDGIRINFFIRDDFGNLGITTNLYAEHKYNRVKQTFCYALVAFILLAKFYPKPPSQITDLFKLYLFNPTEIEGHAHVKKFAHQSVPESLTNESIPMQRIKLDKNGKISSVKKQTSDIS